MDGAQPQENAQNQQQQLPIQNSLASLRSFASMNSEPAAQVSQNNNENNENNEHNPSNENNENNEEAEELQVIQSKVDKGINRQQIMRMFNEQLEREEKERQLIQKRRLEMKNKQKEAPKNLVSKKSQLQQKKQTKEMAEQQALSEKFARLAKRVEPYCRKYKTMFRPSIYDTRMNRYRFECKQKFFKNLCIGIEQLRQMTEQELSQSERELLQKDPYYVVKRITTLVDAAMVRTLNKGDRMEVSREYKNQWETILSNIKDENNLELKRKILSGSFEPAKVAVANEIDLFTSIKKERMLEKQKQYIAQFTVEKAISKKEPEEEDLMEKPKVEEPPAPIEPPVLKPNRSSFSSTYIDEASINQIEELLSQGQLSRMLKRLQEDIQGKAQQILIDNFKSVFKQ